MRYFNVFGPRQDPTGAYAAVIFLISSLINNNELYINGDGETSRDFCYIDNVIQANMLAATFNDNTINEDDHIMQNYMKCSILHMVKERP